MTMTAAVRARKPVPGDVRTAGPPRGTARRLAVLALIAVAWLLYRPDIRRPFDFVDFPETLLILQRHHGFFDQVAGLTTNLLMHARLNLFVYGVIAAKWTAFGWWTPGWQLSRFATMSLIVVLSVVLLRRLRVSTAGAVAGASMFVVAPAAVRGWVRLTAAEPLVLLLVLVASLLASRWPVTRHRTASAAGMAVLAALVVLTKEVLVVTLALPLVILVTVRSDGRLGAPRLKRASSAAAGAIIAAVAVAMVPVSWAYLNAPASSYGHWFGSARPSVFDLLAMAVAAVLPFLPAGSGVWGMVLANAGFWGLMVCGLPAAIGGRKDLGSRGWPLAIGVAFPVLGAMLYLPWPNYQLVYAVPFLVGGAVLVALAVDGLCRRGRWGRRIAALTWGMVLAYAVPEAASEARRVEAIQVTTSELLPRIASETAVDSVLVAAPQAVLDQRGLFGPRLFMYAQATQQNWPPTRDASCEEAASVAERSPKHVVVWSTFMCGPSRQPLQTVRASFPRVDWGSLRIVADSMRFDILRAGFP